MNNGCPGDGRTEYATKGRLSLRLMASRGAWPTPTVKGMYRKAGANSKAGDGLATAVAMWPTPLARDWKSGAYQGTNSRPLSEAVHQITPGPLNPAWVEWLQGFPIGSTDCDFSGMPVSRSKRRTRSRR